MLLLSTYTLGRPPLVLAEPLARLRAAGRHAVACDLAVVALDPAQVARATVIALATPMHTALTLAVPVAQQVRALNPQAYIVFYGLYAELNGEHLLATVADAVVVGERWEVLVALAQAVENPAQMPGLWVRGQARPDVGPHRAAPRQGAIAQVWPVPDHDGRLSLDQYARYDHAGQQRLAGYVEATRGCLHTCRHCPIVPVYHGRFFAVPAVTVLADVRQQIAAGAEHITFGDPDFLNGPKHALTLARALHAEFPAVTFDFTTKIEHILQHRALFAEFAALGCTFVLSAIESVSDEVLRQLHKGHTAADIDAALEILDAAGIALQPTLVAFTPWTTLDDYLAQIEWIDARGLHAHIPPIQLAIRLLIPPHSAILDNAGDWLGPLDPAAFTYRWAHPDPRLDTLHAQVSARVAEAEALGEDAAQTYAAVRALAYQMAQRPVPTFHPAPRPTPPRLTENWFC